MKVEEIFKYFEGIEFEFKIDHASSFDGFVSILEQDAVFEHLLAESVEPVFAESVVNRITTLLKAESDPQFAHPHDVSIAVYMLAITDINPKMIEFLLIDDPPVNNLFWARFAAKSLQDKLHSPEKQAADEE